MYLISERNSLQIMAFFCIESRLQYQTNDFEWWLLTDFFPRNKDFSTSWPTSDEWRVKLSDDYYHLGFRIWLLSMSTTLCDKVRIEAWSNVGYQWWGTVKDRMDTFQLYMWPAHTLQDSCISHHIAFFSQWENIAKTNHFQ
jgi:hypothetical protein